MLRKHLDCITLPKPVNIGQRKTILWEAGDDIMPAGYYYWSCHTTQAAAEKKAATLQAGKVFHRSQIIFCRADEF